MSISYKTITKTASAETLNGGSKFIAFVSPISSVDDAKKFILTLRKEHPYATHICYAYRIVDTTGKTIRARSSDDREPAGTAGKPMHETLSSNGICNVIACVVRYFGGTLLGASNLLRAYVTATQNAINNAKIVEKTFSEMLDFYINYNEVSVVENFFRNNNIKILDNDFAEDVIITCAVPDKKQTEIIEKLQELLSREVEFETKGKDFV